MPAPPGRARRDAAALADNGGVDGWALLDRVIAGAPRDLVPGGRLIFTLFGFGYERLEHIRAHDLESTLPSGIPETVERLAIQGTAPR
jgi:hypothetical protein